MTTLKHLPLLLSLSVLLPSLLLEEFSFADIMADSNTRERMEPAVLPLPNEALIIPPYAQNDVLLRRAFSSNDQIAKQMIEVQIRKPGGAQNLTDKIFRQNLTTRITILNRSLPPRPLPYSNATTDAVGRCLTCEISRLQEQLANLEAINERLMENRQNLNTQVQYVNRNNSGQENFMANMLMLLSQMSQAFQQGDNSIAGYNQGYGPAGGGLYSLYGANNNSSAFRRARPMPNTYRFGSQYSSPLNGSNYWNNSQGISVRPLPSASIRPMVTGSLNGTGYSSIASGRGGSLSNAPGIMPLHY
jgi:hypothetical protein